MNNYHTHTYRCKHASGSDEEYVLSAISMHYEELGFSDHIILPDIKNSYVRADFALKDDYLNSIQFLKEKYQNQIKIFVGFECEWDRNYKKYYQNLLKNKEVEYLIFGNHSCYFKKGKEYGLKISSPHAYLQRYLKKSVAALNSGLFKVMAHPDLFMSSVKWDKMCEKIAYIICKEAKKNQVVLELNCGCIINEEPKMIHGEIRYRYPYSQFWKIAKKVGNQIIVGVDAHSPDAFKSEKLKIMEQFIQEHQLTVIDKLNI